MIRSTKSSNILYMQEFNLAGRAAGFIGALFCLFLTFELSAGQGDYFKIHVVDLATGRGVPMVELRTTANQIFVTDSNGYVAFNEPGLAEKEVFFHIRSHGYEYPKDKFGFAGKQVKITPGHGVVFKIGRINIAERIYRVTGYGVYRDTVLLGETPPIREPLTNGLVTGSDSVQMVEYAGKLLWFWGDTNRPRYPLGNFHVPGATSMPPAVGGLDPSTGINLNYFKDVEGFAARTAQMGKDGFTWLSGLVSFQDSDGRDRMFAHFVRGVSDPKTMWKIMDRGVMEWDAKSNRFQRVAIWSMNGPFPDGAHSFLHEDYVYFCDPFPRWRVAANAESVIDQSSYESYSCLPEGTQTHEELTSLVDFSWKRNTTTLSYGDLAKADQAGRLQSSSNPWKMVDADSGDEILPHRGSVAWNDFRNRWIMIFGISPDLGQIHYSEAEDLTAPWSPARKVITHDRYSFYNPVHHPELDQAGGRVVYFEGTYTQSFSSAPTKTPLYDYNQIMYRLDLGDSRLKLDDEPGE